MTSSNCLFSCCSELVVGQRLSKINPVWWLIVGYNGSSTDLLKPSLITKTFRKLTLCTGWYSCHGEMWLLWQGAGNLAIYMTAPSFSHFSLSNNILTKWGAIGKSFGIYCRLYCLLACLSLPPILEKDIGRVLKKRFVKSEAIAQWLKSLFQ